MRPPIKADTGIVKIQAQTIRIVTPQRTAVNRFAEPTPDIAPVMTWVVLTGAPKWVAKKMLKASGCLGTKTVNGFQSRNFLTHVFLCVIATVA